jgi:cytoskeletal protein RodZ
MASLTPLSKGLIGLAVVGAMASAVWHLALKERFNTPPSTTTPSAQPTPSEPPSPSVTPSPTSTPTPPGEAPAASHSGGLSPADHAEKGRQLIERGDFAQARTHLEQAVQGGDAGAACHLGEMTLKGQGGIAADQAAAAQLFQLAQSRNAICFAPGQ